MGKSEQLRIGIGGLVFVVLALVLVALVPMPPSVNASSASLALHYAKSKHGVFFAGGFVTMAAVVVVMFWFVYFRDRLASAAGKASLTTIRVLNYLPDLARSAPSPRAVDDPHQHRSHRPLSLRRREDTGPDRSGRINTRAPGRR